MNFVKSSASIGKSGQYLYFNVQTNLPLSITSNTKVFIDHLLLPKPFLQLLNLIHEAVDVDAAIYHFLVMLDSVLNQMGAAFGEAAYSFAINGVEIVVGVVVGTLAKVDALVG